jgi:hypothetical protein
MKMGLQNSVLETKTREYGKDTCKERQTADGPRTGHDPEAAPST